MTVESVTQAVSNLALQFGEEDADPGAMVSVILVSSFFIVLWDLGHLSCKHNIPRPSHSLLHSHLS